MKAGKMTGQVLAKALSAALRRIRDPKSKHGKQSVKSLARQGGGLQNIEVTDSNIKAFERSAREFGVDFALKREKDDPTRWVVFFKAKDADTMTAAFQHFIG
ncbi:PcfB family protein, partial [Tyzzerella sp. OttesenSCG-928-J15]|nr:PcfB family protein [Tyzzerella sp. OttesenSCG-928-J15]